MKLCHALCISAALPCTVATAGEEASFTFIPGTNAGLLGGTARDITPDGSIVVGTVEQKGFGGAYYWRWQEDPAPVNIGGEMAVAISDDGSVIAGNIIDEKGNDVAAIWTEEGGWQSLGWLPDALSCPSRSSAYDISADGSTVVGLSWSGCFGRAFRWTAETGMEELQVLGNDRNRASVISDDAEVIGGFAQGTFNRTPAKWIADGTGSLFDIDDLGEVNGINADGSMLTGVYNGEAYYWTEATGFVPIGTLTPSPAVRAMGVGIAGDGTIVGFDINQFPTEAWLWTEEGGLESLRGKLVELGLTDLPTLQVGMDISLDGRTIIGHTFFTGAWIVTLPGEPCPADIDGDGDVGFSDLLAVITAWGPCPGCPEDLDGNNAVEFADLLVVLTEWGRCP